MMDNFLRTSTETASSDEWAGQRAHNHINFSRIDVLVLSDASAGPSQDAK